MWGIVESYSNLTPRGLQYPLSDSEYLTELLQKQQLDSFLLPKRSSPKKDNKEFESMIFVWNGKYADPLIKSFALSKAFDLENQINKGKDGFLSALFSGGVIQKREFLEGNLIQLLSAPKLESEIKEMRQTVFLFKFLFPQGCLSSEEQQTEEEAVLSTVSTAESSPGGQQFKNFQALIKAKSCSNSNNFVHYTPKHIPKDSYQQPEIGQPKQSRKVPGLDISKLHKEAVIQVSWGNNDLIVDGIKIVEREQVQWKDIEGKEALYERIYGPEFVKRIKMQYFREQCSEIISNLLYLGGEKVAQNSQLLENIGITHIINCAGDVCNNQFPKQFKYQTFYLKDIKEEVALLILFNFSSEY